MTDIKSQTADSGAGKEGQGGQTNTERQVYPGLYRVFVTENETQPNGYMFCAEEGDQLIEYYALEKMVDSETMKNGDTVLRLVWMGKGSFANAKAFMDKHPKESYAVRIKALCTGNAW